MTRAKTIFIYVLLGVFVATAAVGICGVIGWIKIVDLPTATVLVAPCLTAFIALIKAEHLFNDSDTVTKLKQEHHDTITCLNDAHAQEVASIKQAHAQAVAANLEAEKTQKERILDLQKSITRMAKDRPVRPSMTSPLGGRH